jgi:hypothetical protein
MLTAYHTQGFSNAMGTPLGQIPDVAGIVDAIDKFNAGLKEMKATFSSFAETISGFKLRTASEVKVLGLEKMTVRMDLPTGGEILKRALPPLIVATGAVVGTAYLVSFFLKKTCPLPPPRTMSGRMSGRMAGRTAGRMSGRRAA